MPEIFLALIAMEILFVRRGGQKDCNGKQETAPKKQLNLK